MSDRRPQSRRRRRRRRNRPVVIEEGGQDAPDAADDAGGDAEADAEAAPAAASADGGGRTDRRRGQRVQRGQERRNTILGMPRFLFLTMAGLMVVLVATTIAGQLVDPPDQIAGVVEFSDQGRRHLDEGAALSDGAYNSFPPTSGPQAAEGVAPGIYEAGQAPPFARLLPILERGRDRGLLRPLASAGGRHRGVARLYRGAQQRRLGPAHAGRAGGRTPAQPHRGDGLATRPAHRHARRRRAGVAESSSSTRIRRASTGASSWRHGRRRSTSRRHSEERR